MKAILRQIRISPKKANLVAALVRKKPVVEATAILKFTTKKAAPIIKKVLESAIANAENNLKQDKGNLHIEEIIVTEGPTYKRRRMISRGRAHPILKRTSHITVKLGQNAVSEPKEEAKKEEAKPKEEKEQPNNQK
jgi:large subunit ribosomal protein L22